MSLSCTCEEWEGEGVGWDCPKDFVQFMGTAKFQKKKCCSCKATIELGTPCLKFRRFRAPEYDIEYSIYGDGEVDLAPWYMCEACGEIYLNLDALKFCVDINEPMPELLKEYHQISGWKQGGDNGRAV